jgi:hypothetical protein
MTNRSLLDAALAFNGDSSQEELPMSSETNESDLSQLLQESKEELPMIFWSLYEIIKKEKD